MRRAMPSSWSSSMSTRRLRRGRVASTFLTFPIMALTNLADRNHSAVAAGRSPYAAYAKLRAYGIAPAVPDGIPLPELDSDPVPTVIAMADFLTPMDAGKAVIFFLPELTNLDPMQGVLIGQRIDMTDSPLPPARRSRSRVRRRRPRAAG